MAILGFAAVGFAQYVQETVKVPGTVKSPDYPDIDYIKIVEPPGNNRVPQPCTRLQGTGIAQYEAQFRVHGWTNGVNGVPENGGGDDVRVGPVRATWVANVPASLGSIEFTGLFTAAIDDDCGDGPVYARYRHYKEGVGFVMMADTSSIAVIPPDWIPTAPMQDLSKVGSDKE